MGGDIDDLRNPQDDQWDEIMAKGPPAWSAGLCVEVWSHIDVKLVWQGPFSGMSGLICLFVICREKDTVSLRR